MKKNLLSLLLLLIFFHSDAQWIPINPVLSYTYYIADPSDKQLLVIDSLLYAVRSGGLQKLNVNDTSTGYHWENYYSVKKIVADTGSTYVYLRDARYIGRYNAVTQQYENVAGDSLQNEYVNDIDVSPDGKLWVVTQSKKVFVYDGLSWQVSNYTPYLAYGFSDIKTINDTVAYLRGGYYHFFRIHQGVIDTVYSLPYTYFYEDWDVDLQGNLWIAAHDKLVHFDGAATEYDATNTPLGTDKFLHVQLTGNGEVWTAGNQSKLLYYDGSTWSTNAITGYPIENFTLDELDHPWVVAGYNNSLYPNVNLFKFNGSAWTTIPFSFVPINRIKAIGAIGAANDEGLFNIYYSNFSISDFKDTSNMPFANDITCFTVNTDPYSYYSYPAVGTHHGIYNLYGFDNSLLPSDTINYIAYDNGTYYIATDSGLVTFNATLYNYLNTQNSPLPSEKVTYVTVVHNYSVNDLYVGTDNGLAVYHAGQWSVYDTSSIPISHFYVTGVMTPNDFYYDSATYVTTLGSGIIKLFPAGGYELLNTSNGLFLDDSAFYIIHAFLAKCGDFILVGTKNHGIAYFDNFLGSFDYDTLDYYGLAIHGSRLAANSSGEILIVTDSMLYWATPCGAVEENNSHATAFPLDWYQDADNLAISAPENFTGDGDILLIDILGRTIIQNHLNIKPSEKIILNLDNAITGTYLLQLNMKDKSATAKIIVHH